MAYIIVKNKKILFDDRDKALVCQYKWSICKDGYARAYGGIVGDKQITIRMHRLIMSAGYKDQRIVDHINHNTLDNRRKNLRFCTLKENVGARIYKGPKTSLFRGVYRSGNKWRCQITFNYKRIHIGLYKTEVEAAAAYNKAISSIRKSFAIKNIIKTKGH